jgi:hypothetical protein
MARKGGKGKRKAGRKWLVLLLLVPVLVLGSLVLFEALFQPPLQRRPAKVSESRRALPPRLAILIDDGGYHLDLLREVLKLGKPMTYAILPGAPHTREAALLVHRLGGEVMLHLPMEPKEENPSGFERDMVKGAMSSAEIRQILRDGLSRVPHVRGMNPHMGSRATEDPRVMEAIMEVLKERGLYYIDSHTSPHSAGMRAAQARGVPAGQNGKFIDAVRKAENIREAVLAAATAARRQGKAFAIGHPDPLTVRAIRELVPEIEKTGVRLVFASEIVG